MTSWAKLFHSFSNEALSESTLTCFLSTDLALQNRPYSIIQRIQIGRTRRPLGRTDKFRYVFLQPLHRRFGFMRCCWVLLVNPLAVLKMMLWPWKTFPENWLLVHLGVYLDSLIDKNKWCPTCGSHCSPYHDRGRLLASRCMKLILIWRRDFFAPNSVILMVDNLPRS